MFHVMEKILFGWQFFLHFAIHHDGKLAFTS